MTAASDPLIGEELGPKQLVASADLIRSYVNSAGDEGFARHAAAMQLAMASVKIQTKS